MGRAAGGVRGIKLGSGDVVAQAGVVRNSYENSRLLVMSQNGFGKTTPIKEYKVQKRGGTGIKTAKVTAKTGGIILAKVVTDEDSELIVISKKSQVIRTELKDIPTLGRQTQGVRIMKLRSEDEIASFVCF